MDDDGSVCHFIDGKPYSVPELRDALRAKAGLAVMVGKLRRVRDLLKFAANSEGGIVAEIDATLEKYTERR